jgi:hypothetical protein
MVEYRVQANKRISHHHLMDDSSISRIPLRFLERGVQESMDKEEVCDEVVEVAISYTGSIGTSLWSEIKEDRALVDPGYDVVIVDSLTWT